MGIGVIAANIGIKISASVDAVATSTSTLYTCPASSYAILNVRIDSSAGTTTITNAGNTIASTANSDTGVLKTIYVGPNQAVACTISSTGQVSISGVEFINSP